MPNRIIKESICTSETIDQMSWFEECFWQRLIVNCDDYGRFDGRPAVLKSRLFPLKERITLKDIEHALTKLAGIGCVVLYEYDGKPCLYLPTWEVHQMIRAKKSKYPAPDENQKTSDIICNQEKSDESNCHRNPIQSESEFESESNAKVVRADAPRRFTKPTVREIREFCIERGNGVDPLRFFDFYEAKGWRVGNQPMKDWKAAVRTWESRESAKPRDQASTNPFKQMLLDEEARNGQTGNHEDISDSSCSIPEFSKGYES